MQARNPGDVHAPVAAYSHQIEVAAGARWPVLAGQVGMRADGTLPADAIAQIEVALDNLRRNLVADGMEVGDVSQTDRLPGRRCRRGPASGRAGSFSGRIAPA